MIQALREENEALKQEMEVIKSNSADQAGFLKIFIKKEWLFSPPVSVLICLKLSLL